MPRSLLGLLALIAAYLLYTPSLPAWALLGLILMVCLGLFGTVLSYLMQDVAIRAWFNRYF